MDKHLLFLINEVVKLLPVITGALLTVLGGVGSQYLIDHLNKKRDRKLLLQEKAEIFVKALYANNHWLNKQINLLFSEVDYEKPSPLDEAQMIQRLYFPNLAPFVEAMREAQLPMVDLLHNQRIAQLGDKAAWIKDNDTALLKDMYRHYLKAFHSCVEQMGIYIQNQLNG